MAARRASLAVLAGSLDDKLAERAFLRWVNWELKSRGRSVSNLGPDFCDGVNLCHLLEIISGSKLGFHANPTTQIKRTENVHIALEYLSHKMGFKSYGLNAADIEACF